MDPHAVKAMVTLIGSITALLHKHYLDPQNLIAGSEEINESFEFNYLYMHP